MLETKYSIYVSLIYFRGKLHHHKSYYGLFDYGLLVLLCILHPYCVLLQSDLHATLALQAMDLLIGSAGKTNTKSRDVLQLNLVKDLLLVFTNRLFQNKQQEVNNCLLHETLDRSLPKATTFK